MIHATFEDNTTMLFEPMEIIMVCEEILAGEYIVGEHTGSAAAVVKPGVYVLEKPDTDGAIVSDTRVLRVREV